MKNEVWEEDLFAATIFSYPMFENLKQNDRVPADKVWV